MRPRPVLRSIALKKKLSYLGAVVLALILFGVFGILIPNRAGLATPKTWDIHWFHGGLALVSTLGFSAFLIEALFDRREFAKDITSLGRYRYLLVDLVGRDVKTKYRRSVLGILWSVLNPLLMMLVLNIIFAHVIKVQVNPTDPVTGQLIEPVPNPGGFPLFYLAGYLIFVFVQEATTISMQSIFYAAPLIKKVYLPKLIFPLEKCIFSMVNLLFSLIAFAAVYIFFAIKDPTVVPSFTMLLFPLALFYVFVFALGLSLILAAAYVFFRDIAHIYGVFITVWMYASPIIYPKSFLDGLGPIASIVRFNPLFHYIEYFRDVMIRGSVPGLYENLICLLFSFLFLAVGIAVFRRAQNKFVLHL